MTDNIETIAAAVRQAIVNGWVAPGRFESVKQLTKTGDEYIVYFFAATSPTVRTLSAYRMIFDHGFAKALWDKPFPGTSIPATYEVNLEDIPAWQYHLQMMAIAPDPIEYLGTNL